MKTRLLVFAAALLSMAIVSCNKRKSYLLEVQNISSKPIYVKVNYDSVLAAPGQNTLTYSDSVYQGQTVKIYFNEGLGIDLPTMKDKDSLLQYVVRVWDENGAPSLRNFRSIRNYSLISGSEKKPTYHYRAQILDIDFP